MDAVLAETPTSAFHRSHSTSDLTHQFPARLDVTKPIHTTGELPRSASYSYLPDIQDGAYNDNDYFTTGIVKPLSVKDNAHNAIVGQLKNAKAPQDTTKQTKKEKKEKKEKRKSTVSGWMSRMMGSTERVPSKPTPSKSSERRPVTSIVSPRPIPSRTSSLNSRAVNPAPSDQSTSTSSRSPSPSKKREKDPADSSPEEDSTPASSVSSSSPKASFLKQSQTKKTEGTSGLLRRGTQLLKRTKETDSANASLAGVASVNGSTTTLGAMSALNLSALQSGSSTPQARHQSRDKLNPLGSAQHTKKDELWTAFRSLESDYMRFQSKTSTQKTSVVRSTLLPFLRNHFYVDHHSTKSLSPENLERRVNILSKWWQGLLDMIESQSGMSGIDRPVILDAIVGIMMRPEWRLPPSPFAPLVDQSRSMDNSSNSLNSDSSRFASIAIYHRAYEHVRATFVRHLSLQMATVVDKMSLRHAPASLVSFCGKAVAYAFFFCPGVAEMLVRIWKTPLPTIKRVADELDLPRRPKVAVEKDDIVEGFPPNMRDLAWTSPRTMLSQLQKPYALMSDLAKIPWFGNWAGRWCGRDSDLFYVFCKHYHILLENYVPTGTPLSERARSPAFVLVYAQLLAVLDETLKRSGRSLAVDQAQLPLEDGLSVPEATVPAALSAALPVPPSSNILRLMSENRLISLLKEFLSERSPELENAKHSFAEAFSHIITAAVKRTSLYDNNACFVLCDFLEEALPVYVRYHNSNPLQPELVDWSFWLKVCQRMLESNNTLSEIRLLAFIYTIWRPIVEEPSRRETVSIDWLISEETFNTFFLHWCPMVRAYFMRLLCWRISRYDGEPNQLDENILSIVLRRLNQVWTYYQHQKQVAMEQQKAMPNSTPCAPVPGRRLLITRSDTQPPAAGLAFFSFDGIMAGRDQTKLEAISKRHSMVLDSEMSAKSLEAANRATRRWSIMSKANPFNNENTDTRGLAAWPLATMPNAKKLEEARQSTAAARSSGRSSSKTCSTYSSESDTSTPSTPDMNDSRSWQSCSFSFSLEWDGKTNQMTIPERQAFSRNRRIQAPTLPSPAMKYVQQACPEWSATVFPEVFKREDQQRIMYAGRALSEWANVVAECDSFVERRLNEGVPSIRDVEVPVLRVESWKKYT